MDREAVIELMARAMFEAPEPKSHWDDSVELADHALRDDYRDYAKAALDALETANLGVTPREPTDEMTQVGFRHKYEAGGGVADCWEAMHDARPSRPVEEG